MILRITRTTAALVGETPAEWQLLEKQVRAGRWTSGPQAEEGGLRTLAAETRGGGARGRRGEDAATAQPTATACLKWRQIDQWVAYANSVVEE